MISLLDQADEQKRKETVGNNFGPGRTRTYIGKQLRLVFGLGLFFQTLLQTMGLHHEMPLLILMALSPTENFRAKLSALETGFAGIHSPLVLF